MTSHLKSHEKAGDVLKPVEAEGGAMKYHDEKGRVINCTPDSLVEKYLCQEVCLLQLIF
jgi:hypothetical protein